MRSWVMGALALMWILWLLPFGLGNRRNRNKKPAVIARSARWGILLQGIAYAMVFGSQYGFWTRPLSPWRIVPSMLIGTFSVVFAWIAVENLGRQWRVDAGLNADHELVRSGPYRIVRHPIYASMLGMFLTAGLLLPPWPVFLVGLALFITGTEIRVRTEDRLLSARFRESFERWRSQTPAYIPLIR